MYPTFSRTSFLNIKVTGMCLILFSRSYRETWGRSKYGVSLIGSLGPSAIQSNRDHLLMSSKHSADWSQCCQKFCWEGLTLIGVMLKAHLRPFWFPCGMARGQPLLITSPRKAAQSGWLICHTPWALQRKQEWAPFSTASASPLEGQWTQQGHRNLSFCFPPTARSWLYSHPCLGTFYLWTTRKIKWVSFCGYFLSSFPYLPHPCAFGWDFFRVKYKQNTAAGSSSQCSSGFSQCQQSTPTGSSGNTLQNLLGELERGSCALGVLGLHSWSRGVCMHWRTRA